MSDIFLKLLVFRKWYTSEKTERLFDTCKSFFMGFYQNYDASQSLQNKCCIWFYAKQIFPDLALTVVSRKK